MATRGLPTWPHLNDTADSLPDPERLILAAAGAEGAALLLDPLLRGLPGLQPGCRLCPNIHQTESALLLAVSAVQQGRRSMALGLLHRLAPPLAAYRAMPALIHLACALKRGGVTLEPRL